MGKDVEDQTSISSEGESFTEKERTPSVPPAPPHGEEENTEMVQEVMRDNLDIMLDIILRIRAEPGFAKSIYADCPRLQYLLDQHPDLRPIFEDPALVRINFEQVYRDAGGTLPEDEPTWFRKCLTCVVRHPLFKVLRFLLLIKKCYSCITGGGISMIKDCICGLCCEGAAGDVFGGGGGGDHGGGGDGGGGGGGDGDADGPGGTAEAQAARDAMNRAADHMEEPDVQERMQAILDNPDTMDEAIENDPELRALRDSNPLCAELLADPDTARILTDPDNLRALGECPELIEADFADPNWQPPDIETPDTMESEGAVDQQQREGDQYELGDHYNEGGQQPVEAEGGADGGAEYELGDQREGGQQPVASTEDGAAVDYELGEAEGGGLDYELGDQQEGPDTAANATASGKKGPAKKQQQRGGRGEAVGGGGLMSRVTAGITDMVAAELVGMSVTEMTGGGDDFGGLEEQADTAASAADHADNAAGAAATTVDVLTSDAAMDNLDHLEMAMDEVEETHEIKQKAAAAGAGAGAGLGVYAATRDGSDSEEEEEEEEKPEKKSRFGFVGNFAGAVATAAKEQVAGALLGDDFGEDLVEKLEEDKEEQEDEEAEEDKKESKRRWRKK